MKKIICLLGLLSILAITLQAQTMGTMTDPRDGQIYKTVIIEGKTWMAQNLNYMMDTSVCVIWGNYEASRKTVGLYYTHEGAKKACPSGWHVPSSDEMTELWFMSRDNVNGLKSNVGWNEGRNGENLNGTNSSGFNGQPAGLVYSKSGENGEFGEAGYWWGHDLTLEKKPYLVIYELKYGPPRGRIRISPNAKGWFSYNIRCVKD